MARPLRVTVVGATGAVGRALVQALEEGDLPVAELRLLASERSAGTEVEFQGDGRTVAALRPGAFDQQDVAFLAASAAVSREQAPLAARAGCAVVDLSPAFRGDATVPLVLPFVNADVLAGFARGRLAAVPGPTAGHLATALAPLHRAAGVERADVVSLQSVSGAGQRGVEELEAELRAMLGFQEPPAPTALPHRAAFNAVPQAGPFADDGASEEERDAAAELRRLLGSSLRVAVTVVRVPVFYGHLHALTVKLRRPLAPEAAREALRAAPGVKVLDTPREGVYPMPMLAVNDEAVLVGRVRAHAAEEGALQLVVAGDNVRQPAAAAIAAAKLLVERGLLGG